MTTTEINLTDSQANALHALARRTGKSEDDLLREAVDRFIGDVSETATSHQKRLESLRQAKGMWKDRQDLPDFEKLRREWDRFDLGSN
jgi:predicted DNA-binding protein